MTLEDLCFRVCTALDAVGTQVVLTGGSAATYYAPDAYQSSDADFIITFGNSGDAARALLDLGFKEVGGVYRSDATPYTLEFPPGPLMVGSDYLSDFATVRKGSEVLYVLHPTDCVRDRLVWYFHYGDFAALTAAVGVAKRQSVDMAFIREWSIREQSLDRFESFARQVASLG
jgi:hypothetical protein